jgi:hypothetical protein
MSSNAEVGDVWLLYWGYAAWLSVDEKGTVARHNWYWLYSSGRYAIAMSMLVCGELE